ncbi:MAG: hypothetical protein M3256_20220 [Actinomycetota bacterium]|nr:hypothetical protein [Actinomycetota bacterium]
MTRRDTPSIPIVQATAVRLSSRRPHALILPAFVAVSMVALACCGGSPSSSPSASLPAIQHLQLDFGGMTRTYRLFIPFTLNRQRPAPLVVVLGGYNDTADTTAQLTHFDPEASSNGFVAVYPEGVGLSWNAGFCCGHNGYGADDVGFVNAVIDQLQSEYRIEAVQVYAVGFSSGAFMAYRLACEDSSRIAGIGSVAGATALETCHPAKPVSVIEINGTVDPQVPFQGGEVMPTGTADHPIPSAANLVQGWAQLDACPGASTLQTKGPVTITAWVTCQAGTGVNLIAVDGGDHSWFAPALGPTDGAIDATDAIWHFLDSHRRTG